MITKEITLKEDKLNEYILNNFKEGALLEISYNRVFVPGILLFIDDGDELIITVQLKGKLLNQTVDINIDEIKKELVELRYSYNQEVTVISIAD